MSTPCKSLKRKGIELRTVGLRIRRPGPSVRTLHSSEGLPFWGTRWFRTQWALAEWSWVSVR